MEVRGPLCIASYRNDVVLLQLLLLRTGPGEEGYHRQDESRKRKYEGEQHLEAANPTRSITLHVGESKSSQV